MINEYSYTESGSDYPAYISVEMDEQELFTVFVRSKNQSECSHITLTKEQVRQLAGCLHVFALKGDY